MKTCAWPEGNDDDPKHVAESARRAALLGLCAKPAEKSAEERLADAGATEIHKDKHRYESSRDGVLRCYLAEEDNTVNLHAYGLPLPRAVAALRAATGKQDHECPSYQERAELVDKLAAANARLQDCDGEIERLKAIIIEAAVIIEDLNPLPSERVNADNWLARNKGPQ